MSMRYCDERTCKKWKEGKCKSMERVANGVIVYVDMDCLLAKGDLSYNWSSHKDHLQNPNERR